MLGRPLEVRTARDEAPTAQILDRLGVGPDHPGPRTRFDRHVAHRHPLFHRERLDRFAAVLDDMTGAAVGGDASDDAEDQILGGHAGLEAPVGANLQRPGLGLPQTLRGEHVLDLAGADAEGERAERAVGGGMAVAAHDGHAGLGEAQLGSDDVHDTLFGRAEVEQAHAELAAVAAHHFNLRRRIGVGDRLGTVGGRHVVILGAEGAVERAHLAPAVAQGLEGLRRCDLVHQVQIDIKQRGFAGLLADHVAPPDFFEKRLSRHVGN